MELYLGFSIVTWVKILLVFGFVTTVFLCIVNHKLKRQLLALDSFSNYESIISTMICCIPLCLPLVFYRTSFINDAAYVVLSTVIWTYLVIVPIYFHTVLHLMKNCIKQLLQTNDVTLLSDGVPVVYQNGSISSKDLQGLQPQIKYGELLLHLFWYTPEIMHGDIIWMIPIYSPAQEELFRIQVRVEREKIVKDRMHKDYWDKLYYSKRIGYVLQDLLHTFVSRLEQSKKEVTVTIPASSFFQKETPYSVLYQNEEILKEYKDFLQKNIIEKIQCRAYASFEIVENVE